MTASPEFLALGIDPGTAHPGLALLRQRLRGARWELVHLPVLRSLDGLALELQRVTSEHGTRIDVVSVEAVAWANHAAHQGHGSGRILEAVGMARLLATMLTVDMVEVYPSTWRKALTGNGRATKEAVRRALERHVESWPARASTHRSDAAAIAIAGAMAARKGRK